MSAPHDRLANAIDLPVPLMEAYAHISRELGRLERLQKTLREAIEERIGDAEYAKVNNELVAKRGYTNTRRLDQNKLRENVDPVVLASCYVEAPGRRFTILKSSFWKDDD